MKIRGVVLLLASVLPAVLFSEPVKIPREQAYKLRSALAAIAPGLTPANTIVAADDLNALAAVADGVAKASLRMEREQLRVPDSPDRAIKLAQLAEDFDAKTEEIVEIELSPIEITSDEIKDAKIAPANLAPIRRWLKPPKK